MQERLDYIDNAKGILIIFIVLGHIFQQATNHFGFSLTIHYLGKWIYSFHISGFCLITGMLFDHERWREKGIIAFVQKRVFTLLVPYAFFEFLGAFFSICVLKEGEYDWLGAIIKSLKVQCNTGADWYLPTIFIAQILMYYIMYCDRPAVRGIIAVLCICVTYFFGDSYWAVLPGRILVATGYLILGNILRNFYLSEKKHSWIYVGVAFLILVVASNANRQIDLWSLTVGNPILYIICGLTGTYVVISISKYIHNKALAVIGNNSLTIMGTHQIFLKCLPFMVLPEQISLWTTSVISMTTIFQIIATFLLNLLFPHLVARKPLYTKRRNK